MGVPALRTSSGRRNKRRSHLAIQATKSVACPNCGANRLPHRACPSCGYVRPGLQVRASEGE